MHKEYINPRGVRYSIHGYADGRFEVWQWSNQKSGWAHVGKFPEHDKAFDFMVSISSGDPREIPNDS